MFGALSQQVATSGDDPDDEKRAAGTLLDRNVDGLILATAHLIDLGHQDIAVVTGPSLTSSGIARLAGARAAINEAGIEPPEPWLLAAGYGIEDSFTAGSALLAGYTKKR